MASLTIICMARRLVGQYLIKMAKDTQLLICWSMLIPVASLCSCMPPCIRFCSELKARPVAHGVVFRDATGAKHRAYLKNGPKNEIIVSAGALGSPQLLMLSG
ncbi:hypothetical protein CISIN_1g0081632mg, partial [Citrus sinensis]